MAYGDTTFRQPAAIGTGRVVNPDDGITSFRRPDEGALFPDFINYSPSMIGVDFVSTDNIELQSVIAEHIAWVESTAVDFKVGSGINPTMRWLDTAAAAYADVGYNATLAAFTIESKDSLLLWSPSTLGVVTGSYSYIQIVNNGAGGSPSVMIGSTTPAAFYTFNIAVGAGAAGLAYFCNYGGAISELQIFATGATLSYLSLPDTSCVFRVGFGSSAGSLPIDFRAGSLVFQLASGRTKTVAGAVMMVGFRLNATGAFAHGYGVTYPHQRSDTAGNLVTPGSVTFSGAPILNTNANTPQFRGITSLGASFTINATAAGIVDYENTVTIN